MTMSRTVWSEGREDGVTAPGKDLRCEQPAQEWCEGDPAVCGEFVVAGEACAFAYGRLAIGSSRPPLTEPLVSARLACLGAVWRAPSG